VPKSLAGLPDLHTLDLGNNRLEGAIPTGLLLPSSPSLKVLILANNGGLSGHIPAQFSSSHGPVGAHVKDLLGPNSVSLAGGSFGQQFQSSLRPTLQLAMVLEGASVLTANSEACAIHCQLKRGLVWVLSVRE
jgi:hypothetical protein